MKKENRMWCQSINQDKNSFKVEILSRNCYFIVVIGFSKSSVRTPYVCIWMALLLTIAISEPFKVSCLLYWKVEYNRGSSVGTIQERRAVLIERVFKFIDIAIALWLRTFWRQRKCTVFLSISFLRLVLFYTRCTTALEYINLRGSLAYSSISGRG